MQRRGKEHGPPCQAGPQRGRPVLFLAPKKAVPALPAATTPMLSLPATTPAAVPRLDGGGPLQPITDAVAFRKPPLL